MIGDYYGNGNRYRGAGGDLEPGLYFDKCKDCKLLMGKGLTKIEPLCKCNLYDALHKINELIAAVNRLIEIEEGERSHD